LADDVDDEDASIGQVGDVSGPAADRIGALVTEAREIPADDPRRIAASIAMFEQLAGHWALRGDERETLLGGISKSTWSEWKQRPLSARMKPDTRERIANLFTIDLNAHSLFAPEFADRWVRQPNAAFEGQSAADVMLRGKVEDIVSVRRYLERVRSSSPAPTGVEPSEAASESAPPPGARPALEHAVLTLARLVHERPGRFESTLASALENLATYLIETGEVDAALPVLHRVIEIRAKVDPTNDLHRVTTRFRDRARPDEALFTAMRAIEAKHPRTAEQFTRVCDNVFTTLDMMRARQSAPGQSKL
jgi:hypothetical protein